MSTLFRYSTDSNSLNNIPLHSNNHKFIKGFSTNSTASLLSSNNNNTNNVNYSKRIQQPPSISKYKSNTAANSNTNNSTGNANSSFYNDNESVTSTLSSNNSTNNSTIATSTTSPALNLKSNPAFNNTNNNNQHSTKNNILDDEDLYTIDSHFLNHAVFNDNNLNTMNSNNDPTYQLTRLDTRVSLENYYVEPQSDQYNVKLNLTQKQIDLIRYTWNKMLLEEESNPTTDMPGFFPDSSANKTPASSPSKAATSFNTKDIANAANASLAGKKALGKKNTNTRFESTTIASSLFCRQLYDNIMYKNPELERLFPSIKHQAVSFAGILTLIISQLENLSNLDDYLCKLGKLHSRILNIEAVDFQVMGEALIQTFQERFGKKFTKELENLWIKLYLYLANNLYQNGMDPTLKLTRYESNSSFVSNFDMTSPSPNLNSTSNYAGSNSLLRDDLSSNNLIGDHFSTLSRSNSNLLQQQQQHQGQGQQLHSASGMHSSNSMTNGMSGKQPLVSSGATPLSDTTILEEKPGIKKRFNKMRKKKGENCTIM
ncbi:hypothetical protein G210_2840 [Candida maltosa Xu316]|uniref:Globin domain-containing protein n=1 Tax=Candida maltosa (strain Xu316) TaxID=1245528 RepID=M3JWV7_CANMX|nr:hypothetical protein G210_2840 [Candida maltosa Xu316]